MDDVSSKRTVVDILGKRNILKRRDASCNIQFTPVGRGKLRKIETDPIYGATLQCDNEFYQGCLADFRNSDPKFTDFILDFFLQAIKVDLDSNAYFGDIDRADDASGIWNWNTFDGIFKKVGEFIADGSIPSAQTFNIASGSLAGDPAAAYNVIKTAFLKQDILLNSLPPTMKAFYVDQDIFQGYHDYLMQTGGAFNIGYYLNGIPKLSYMGIPILVEPTWNPVMTVLNGGAAAYACILTIRGNFIFATDKEYGERTDKGVKSLMVWYSWDDMVWKYAMFMKAGTSIALPEHMVVGMTSIA